MSTNDIVIVGAGGLGREVLFQINEINKRNPIYNVLGFIDDYPKLLNQDINGIKVIGDLEWLENCDTALSVAVCIGNPKARKSVCDRLLKNTKLSFPNIFADDFRYSETVSFGIGCIACFSCIATVNINIGDFVIISNDCAIGHDSSIEDYTILYPSVNISGNVSIGKLCEIGVGTNIIQGKTIGDETVLGAGAVVINDIPACCTAVGVPAKVIKYHVNKI